MKNAFKSIFKKAFEGYGAPENTGPSSAAQSLHLVICQDADSVRDAGHEVVKLLSQKGHNVTLHCVASRRELMDYLGSLGKSRSPDAFFLDVMHVGEKAAGDILAWFAKNHPAKPLPVINFMSTCVRLSIDEIGLTRELHNDFPASYVDNAELTWVAGYLQQKRYKKQLPAGTAFRELLNAKFGTTLPLDHDDEYYRDRIREIALPSTARMMRAYQNGGMQPETVIERMRDYATGVARALQDQLYDHKGLTEDAVFYQSAGFPVKGPVVFSRAEVLAWPAGAQEKPVLIMQSFDPDVSPLLSGGRLGGLIVLSPYMASHLKLLCDANLVSGLFGMILAGQKNMTAEFNDTVRPDLAPYFTADVAAIAGQTVRRGQTIVMGVNGNGLALDPGAAAAKIAGAQNENNEKMDQDLRNLQRINSVFQRFFYQRKMPGPFVKANLDSANPRMLERLNSGVGLVRTEQMVAGNERAAGKLVDYLLSGNANDAEAANALMSGDYGNILQNCKPVRLRLFDFVHREILDAGEQKKFLHRYGTLDIHGGAALKTWPDLYRSQIRTIFSTWKKNRFGMPGMEIMMPAVRTAQDVRDIKALLSEESRDAYIDYKFGVMIETLKSCENIEEIAPLCDFISFGTNDLTQEFYGISRSDLPAHARFAADNGYDPFRRMSPEILALMRDVAARARYVNNKLSIGACGAQAADVETAAALWTAGIREISVAPSTANLAALPILINYRLYDQVRGAAAAPAVSPAPAP